MATAKNVKPTTKNSPAVTTGKAPNNKDASAYEKRGTSAADGEAAVVLTGSQIDALEPAIGNLFKKQKGENKNGSWEFRGAGAATKGRKSYGPLA
jgi:hypothetical protein